MNNITHQKISDEEFVINLAKEISRKGGCVYFVGGFVRDKILNRSNKDIDIEVHGISQEKLVNILQRFGKVDIQGKSFGVFRVGKFDIDISQPRREIKTGDKHTDFEVVVDPFMGTEEAAKRRDFTINALMQNVLTGEIIDHFGGLEDLKNGIIRHVSDDTFAEDALRVLRAAQFAARFNFIIAPETKKIMEGLDLSNLPKERINEEMKKALLKSDKPSIFFNVLREVNQLGFWFPEIKSLIDSPQNEIFHPEGDTYNHTMMVLDNLVEYRKYSNIPYELMISGLCHDFGKPLVVTWNSLRQVHQNIGHAHAGLIPAEKFVDRIINDNKLKEIVLEAVEFHDDLLKLYDINAKVIKTNMFFDSIKNPENIISVTCADRTSSSNEFITTYRNWLLDRLSEYRNRVSKPEVTGKDLIDMGMKPSPEFTNILKDAHERHLRYEDKEAILKSIRKKYGYETEEDKMLSVNSFVKKAFDNAKNVKTENGNYQEAMLAQRVAGDNNAGSSYDLTINELRRAIFKANWTEVTHPNVQAPCRVFITNDIDKGRNGVRNIEDFSDDTIFIAIDRKDTGFVSIGVSGENVSPYVETTYLIVGPEEINGKSEDIVYTFHLGEPLSLKHDQTTIIEIPDGTLLTKQKVLDLGFKHCKLMNAQLVESYMKKL